MTVLSLGISIRSVFKEYFKSKFINWHQYSLSILIRSQWKTVYYLLSLYYRPWPAEPDTVENIQSVITSPTLQTLFGSQGTPCDQILPSEYPLIVTFVLQAM